MAAHTIQTFIANEPCLSRAGRITAGAGFIVGRDAICVGTGWTFKGTKAGFRRTTIAVVLSIPRVEVHINPSTPPPRVCPTPSTPASRWGIWFRTINICSCSIFLFIIHCHHTRRKIFFRVEKCEVFGVSVFAHVRCCGRFAKAEEHAKCGVAMFWRTAWSSLLDTGLEKNKNNVPQFERPLQD